MTCASDPLCHFCNRPYDRCECRLAAIKSPPIGGEHHLNQLQSAGNLPETAALSTPSGDVSKLCERLLSEVRFLKTLTDADIERSGTMESTMVRAGLLSEILTAFEAQAARIAALEKALEPFARVGDNVPARFNPEQAVLITTECGPSEIPEGCERARLILSLDGTSLADFRTARALLNPTPTEER